MANALGKKKSVILQNHGILYVDTRQRRGPILTFPRRRTVGTTIDSAVGSYFFVQLAWTFPDLLELV